MYARNPLLGQQIFARNNFGSLPGEKFLGRVRLAQSSSASSAPSVATADCSVYSRLMQSKADDISYYNDMAKTALANGDNNLVDTATQLAQQASTDWNTAQASLKACQGVSAAPAPAQPSIPIWVAAVGGIALIGATVYFML